MKLTINVDVNELSPRVFGAIAESSGVEGMGSATSAHVAVSSAVRNMMSALKENAPSVTRTAATVQFTHIIISGRNEGKKVRLVEQLATYLDDRGKRVEKWKIQIEDGKFGFDIMSCMRPVLQEAKRA